MTQAVAPSIPHPTPSVSSQRRERYQLDHIADDALHEDVKRLVGRHNVLTADLLAHLAEVDARGIYRERACSSLYIYCVYELRFSEDEAQRRSQAARTARRFPVLFEMLAEGAIHMTGLLLLAPHLTAENHTELVARARFRTKREIERLVAEVAPQPDAPSRIEPLGPRRATVTNVWQAYTASLCGPVRELEPGTAKGQAPAPVFESWRLGEALSDGYGPASGEVVESVNAVRNERIDDGPASEAPALVPKDLPIRASVATPPVPLRYRVEFTASQEYVDRLEEARNLLQHQVPNRDVACIHELAMAAFVEQLRKRRKAATKHPRARVEEGKAFYEDESAPERKTQPSPAESSPLERTSGRSERVEDDSTMDGSAVERTRKPSEVVASAAKGKRESSAASRFAPKPSTESAPEERMNERLTAEGSTPERMSDVLVSEGSAPAGTGRL